MQDIISTSGRGRLAPAEQSVGRGSKLGAEVLALLPEYRESVRVQLVVRDVSIRDVQHMRSRIKLLEEAIKVLHDSAILQNATLREKLTEMHRIQDRHSVHCLAFAFNVPRGTYYNDLLRAKGENAWFQQRKRLLEPMIRSIHEESHGSYGADLETSRISKIPCVLGFFALA